MRDSKEKPPPKRQIGRLLTEEEIKALRRGRRPPTSGRLSRAGRRRLLVR